ncbi:8-amino-7-oxononanoate synthase [Dongia deserti]|uniref:8-amino-7-oxononanoate synthase n=1 Tax=Dongia deserti TaxID=2268030 RepID=UPI000E65AF01|nr:8-amino-7-oxononanoate synthase [Dongia deserti]
MPSRLDELAEARLMELAEAGRLRRLRPYRREGVHLVTADGTRLLDFSGNDYLGLSRHPHLIARAREWTERYGAGASASRLVTGTFDAYVAVEKKLAAFKDAEAALVFNAGFQANATILPALAELLGETLIYSDRLNHASLHHGIAAAGLRQQRFRHNDLEHLRTLLTRDKEKPGRRLIVTESVFSMDGDRASLADLITLSEEFGAHLYVDEAHATGVLGPQGRGLTAEHPGRIDIVMGTVGKALGGFGAYVAGSRKLIDFLINRCAGFIYSTALPPSVFGALDAALDLVPTMERERMRVRDHAERFRQAAKRHNFSTGASDTQIVPLLIGGNDATLTAQARLEEEGLVAIAIRPPTVPDGEARLRLSLSAAHHETDVARLCDALTGLEPPR